MILEILLFVFVVLYVIGGVLSVTRFIAHETYTFRSRPLGEWLMILPAMFIMSWAGFALGLIRYFQDDAPLFIAHPSSYQAPIPENLVQRHPYFKQKRPKLHLIKSIDN